MRHARPALALSTALALTAAGLAACGPAEDPTAVPTPSETPSPSATPSPSPSPPPVSGPTYHTDVAPIVSRSCSGCHGSGGIAPFSIQTYAEASSLAPLIAMAVESRSMPPWMPGGDTPPLLHDRRLTDAEIATLVGWAEAGAPEGPPRTEPLPLPETIPFTDPEITVRMPEPYTPDAALTDDYRCFIVELPTTEDRMLTAFRITPGNRRTVHHVITTVYEPTDRATLEAADDGSPGPGWTCFGGAASTGSVRGAPLGSWVPGVDVVDFRAGTGTRIPAGGLAVMQVHYNTLGGLDPDQTTLELQLAPVGADLQQIISGRILQPTLRIPADTAGVVVEAEFGTRLLAGRSGLGDDAGFIVGVAGHMHTLGSAIALTLTRADGTTATLLDIPAWDFHWQGSYRLVTPIEIRAGDKVRLRCTYDNTAAHRREAGLDPAPTVVTWGEGTQDEMCLGNVQIVDTL